MGVRCSWMLICLLILVSACGGSGADDKPSVTILSPPDQYSTALGETLHIETRARDDGGISKIELRINGLQVHTADVPGGEKSFRAVQSWTPTDEGIYFVTVIAYDERDQASEPSGITVAVASASTPTTPSSANATASPTSTTLPTSSPTDGCTYDATFVADVTIPDDTSLEPGTEFVKTWRLRNSGTCDWGTDFRFVFVQGEQMGGAAMVSVPPTAAGATVDLSVRLTAPQKPGTYRGRWRMRTPDGQDFGERPFVQIVVPPPATPTSATTPTASPGPKPDLDITLVAGNLELLVGQTLALRVTVRNHGPGATDRPTQVRAVLRPDLQLESQVGALQAGAQAVVILRHIFDAPAELEGFISVDPDGDVDEEDETNNAERVPIIVTPPLYVTRTITVTPGLNFDLDDGASDPARLDAEWRVVEGTVYLRMWNGAGAALLSGEAESVSYALVAGLGWETEQLMLADLAEGALFGFRTSDGRVGYARVEAVLDAARTRARLSYLVWDWP